MNDFTPDRFALWATFILVLLLFLEAVGAIQLG